jgi:hypothetical protein
MTHPYAEEIQLLAARQRFPGLPEGNSPVAPGTLIQKQYRRKRWNITSTGAPTFLYLRLLLTP